MNAIAFAQVTERFAAFQQRFSPFFRQAQTRQRSKQYLQGLLVQDQEQRSAENLAEAVEGANPRALPRFVGERLSEPDGVFVLDDTGLSRWVFETQTRNERAKQSRAKRRLLNARDPSL
ncbi:MAG: hypothetical protein ACR2PL_08420 [Dehalococcoidia bacterium]